MGLLPAIKKKKNYRNRSKLCDCIAIKKVVKRRTTLYPLHKSPISSQVCDVYSQMISGRFTGIKANLHHCTKRRKEEDRNQPS